MTIVIAYWLVSVPFMVLAKQSVTYGFLAGILSIGLMFCGFYLLTVFVHSDSDVAIPGSTYPTHYFTLPVKTSALVLWPVALGCLCLGGMSLLMGLAFRASGFDFSPVDVTLGILAMLTSLQAIFWFPVGISYSKLILSVLAVAVVATSTFVPEILRTGPQVREGLFGIIFLASVSLTWVGVGRARAGRSYFNWARPDVATRDKAPRRALPPFGSPDRAQAWYEWRQHGRILPIMAMVMVGLFLIPYYWNDTLSPIYQLSDANGRVLSVPSFVMVYGPVVLVMIAVSGWAVGCGAKRTDLKRGDKGFHLFFGVRPMRDEALVWAKIKVATLSTLKAWGLVALCFLPLLLAKGGIYVNTQPIDGFTAPLYKLLPAFVSGPMALRAAFAIGVLVFLTWRSYVLGFWAELSGSLFWRYFQPAWSCIVYVVLATLPHEAVTWLLFDRITWIFGGLVVVKLAFAVVLGVRLLRSGLLSGWSAANIGLGYVAGASVLSLAVSYIFRDVPETPHLFLTFLCCFVMPVGRILLAIPMLARTRHR